MAEKNQKNRPAKTKKSDPRNRYMRGSKLSEHRFLKVVRAYADDLTVSEAAKATRIAERSVRPLYDRLRERLMRGVISNPKAFGWSGFFLFEDTVISTRGHAIFDIVSESDFFASTRARHAPRVGLTTELHPERFSSLLFETTVRIFCALSTRDLENSLYSEDIRQAIDDVQEISRFIAERQNRSLNENLYDILEAEFPKLVSRFADVLMRDEFGNLIDNASFHRHSAEVFYNDLRRYLFIDPLS
ncbi:MAG: hypothetical protein AAFY84_12770 [Pseudomonadota bacterium]